ncbi:unnamed protein product, partial [Prorocentrum cordatum]
AARRNRNGPHLRFARFANMLAMFVLVACMTCSAAAVADSRRASEAPRGGEAPVLEVSLDAPAAPYPEIADLISSLEEDRRAVEAAGMRSVRSNFSHAFEIAQDLIGSAVAELARRSGNSSAQRALATRRGPLADPRKYIFPIASGRPRGGRCPCGEIERGPASAGGRSDTSSDFRHRAAPELGGRAAHGAGGF